MLHLLHLSANKKLVSVSNYLRFSVRLRREEGVEEHGRLEDVLELVLLEPCWHLLFLEGLCEGLGVEGR